ncbi:MAG: hypothetical protein K0R50_4595 [Eubacterium sp.]|jgi:malonyl CoA-acyl carrier protein transacylase|nr:hypothetical protein [Eubacterium sp.]
MEETLNLILKKPGKLDKIKADINALKAESKVSHQKLDMIIDEVATIKEQIAYHDMKNQVINDKTKAILSVAF